MGCVSSKNLKSPLSSPTSPRPDSPIRTSSKHGGNKLDKIKEDHAENERVDFRKSSSLKKCRTSSIGKSCGFPIRLGSVKLTQGGGYDGEQNVAASAAAWPAWLTAAAPQAVEGWLPLRSDTFRKLEKVILFVF